jgi:REP element-mobilizing transposase RayT
LNIAPLRGQADILPVNGSTRLPAEIAALLNIVEVAIKAKTPDNVTAGNAALQQELPNQGDGAPPNWMLDPGMTEQRLRSINLPNLIYAVVLVRRESLWAYRGTLPRAMAVNLAQLLVQSWSREQDPNRGARRAGGDMLRFIKLGAQQEFLLYARGLRFGLVLGLAFPSTTPFNAARTHMELVLRELYDSGLNGKASQSYPAVYERENGSSSRISPLLEPAASFAGAGGDDGAALEAALPDFSTLLGDVPDPTPNSMRNHVPDAERFSWPWEVEADDFPEEASSWLRSKNGKQTNKPGQRTFAFVLTPRCRQHMLRGQIAAHVYQRLSEIAYAGSWRLEGISARPNYLRFTAILPDSEPGDAMLQKIRQELSNSLFTTFPDLAERCQGQDFWSADYLASEAGQPLLAQELRQYLLRVGRWLSEPVHDARNQDSDR